MGFAAELVIELDFTVAYACGEHVYHAVPVDALP